MGENYKKKDELKALIKQFEDQIRQNTLGFYSIEEYEAIIEYYNEKGKLKTALEVCKIGVEQHPFSSELILFKAQALANLEQFDEGLEILDKALCLQPTDAEIIMQKAAILAQKGNYEQAIEIRKCFASSA